jgi:hypothetical protein
LDVDPGLRKKVVTGTLAFGAGTMTGGQTGSLIQEEKFCVLARLHDRATASLEVEQTEDPSFASISALDLALIVV